MDERTDEPTPLAAATPAPPAPVDPPTVGRLLLDRLDDQRPGLVGDEGAWTWDDHARASVDRAAWLTTERADGPFHVAVLLDNVPEMSFLLGAAAIAGAVLVGLNPTRRGSELARDVAHTDCQLIVTERRHRRLLDGLDLVVPPDRIHVVDEPAWGDTLAPHRASPAPAEVPDDPDALLMLIFTSGTSGDPKAVRITHRKVSGPGAAMVARGSIGRDDVAYVSMPMFHSASIMQAWAPALTAGATMALRRRFSASGFLPDVRRHGVTYFHYVGKPLAYILDTPERPDDSDNTLRVAAGNEAAPLDIARFAERFGCEVQEGFGSTEGGVYLQRPPGTPVESLGTVTPGVDILDPTGRPVPPARFDEHGVLLNADEAIGELVNTSGPGAFAGYYRNEAAEAERMRDGMYWSGDLAYRDDTGFVYFAGRTIEWLRVDGENLGAAPIERVLSRWAPVSQVAVYAVPDPAVGDQVMAAVVLHDGQAFDPDGFAAFLAAQEDLGTKWSPSFVRVAAALPSTETNKVLKRTLAAQAWRCDDPIWVRDRSSGAYRPITEAEQAAEPRGRRL